MRKIKFLPLMLATCMMAGCAGNTSPETTKAPENTTSATALTTEAQGTEAQTTEAQTTAEETTAAPDEHSSASNGSLVIADNAVDFCANLKLGWNLGNTLDATGSDGLNSEMSWGQPMTTKALIDYVAECGFTSIRIPTSWGKHTDENYTIDPEWMSRVNEIVDYALDAGLYVILNSHHDNDFYYPSAENYENAERYLTTIWTQIADNYSGYDERLIFESMNEPRLTGTNIEWWFNSSNEQGLAAIEQICKLNQVFVNVIRSSEGYNTSRYLMVPGYAASNDFLGYSTFSLPTDTSENRLILSVHAYSPYNFAMNYNGGTSEWTTDSHANDLKFLNNLKKKYLDNGIGVVIGEFGATNKNNLESRVNWAKEYCTAAAANGIPCFLWDNGGTNVGDENFGMIDRRNLKVYFPDILNAMLAAY